jgi:hypothetical protein
MELGLKEYSFRLGWVRKTRKEKNVLSNPCYDGTACICTLEGSFLTD